jgi:ABC-type multidrug transport system fused ATPase/permease subunit
MGAGGGRILEMGSHDALIRKGGMYADLMRQQERDEEKMRKDGG